MAKIPRDPSVDGSLALLREGYAFITNRCRRLRTDIFQTRLMSRPTICLVGEDAARLVYDDERFHRSGAAPMRMQKTLIGVGGVQGLDGRAHRHRKRMFMSLMTPERIEELAGITDQEWVAALRRWEQQSRIVLFSEVQEILCRAVCRWSGVPLPEADVKRRTEELHAMFDGAGALGPRHWRARRARKSAERWIADVIERLRVGQLRGDDETALSVIGLHRDHAGELLDPKAGAVEVINILRPTVAIATFVTFAAVALHQHPEARRFVTSGHARQLEWFVHEVRRFYPFFPFVVARVRDDFRWRGFRFPRGRRVLLDLYGTDHDPRRWEAPDEFRLERFREWDGSAFDFIPQGGGEHHRHHRCPGEWITIEVMKVAVNFLVHGMSYRVPEQDLSISLSRIPAIPKSRFVIERVTPKTPEEDARRTLNEGREETGGRSPDP